MRHVGHGEAEMKPRRIPHRGFADRNIGMHRERRLHIGEGRDDDAPDALDGVERQDAAMALAPGGASCRLRAPDGTPSRPPGSA